MQKEQSRALLQFGKQGQGHRVVRFETGSELVHQTRLHLDQRILVTGQGFELGNFVAIRSQATQFGEVGAPSFRQQVGIDAVCLRSVRLLCDDRPWLDERDRLASPVPTKKQ